MATMKFSLPDDLRDYIKARIENGGYASISDYVHELIRRDQAQTEEEDALRAALIKGEESGVSSRRVPQILGALKARLPGP